MSSLHTNLAELWRLRVAREERKTREREEGKSRAHHLPLSLPSPPPFRCPLGSLVSGEVDTVSLLDLLRNSKTTSRRPTQLNPLRTTTNSTLLPCCSFASWKGVGSWLLSCVSVFSLLALSLSRDLRTLKGPAFPSSLRRNPNTLANSFSLLSLSHRVISVPPAPPTEFMYPAKLLSSENKMLPAPADKSGRTRRNGWLLERRR